MSSVPAIRRGRALVGKRERWAKKVSTRFGPRPQEEPAKEIPSAESNHFSPSEIEKRITAYLQNQNEGKACQGRPQKTNSTHEKTKTFPSRRQS